VAGVRLDDGSQRRYTFALTGRPLRPAEAGDGAWGALAAAMSEGRTIAGFAIRYDGQVYAYANACAHRAIELDWVPGMFFDPEGAHLVCSMHGALYEPHTGRCITGPCVGAVLARLPVRERAGEGSIVLIEDGTSDDVPKVLERDLHG
jgi:nitrite reductase/ring-hydroxylating ferredoxin subunit